MSGRQLAIDDLIQRATPSWVELLARLIQAGGTFEREHAIVKMVEEQIERLGVRVERVEHTAARLVSLPGAQQPFSDVPGRYSLVARVPGSGGGRTLALNAHLDIVPEGDASAWTHPPFSAHVDAAEGKVYGRGAMDDKAGVAIALAVMEALVRAPRSLAGDVMFQFVLEDETTGNGSLLCLEHDASIDGAVIIDGTRSDRGIDQHAGNLAFGVTVRGRPASVSVSHMGIDAGEKLARLVLRLRDVVHALNEQREAPWTQFPSPYQLSTQRLFSQAEQLTLPVVAEARCYMTFPPPHTLSSMRAFLEEHAERFSQEHQLPSNPTFDWSLYATEPVRSDGMALGAALQRAASNAGLPPVGIGPSTGTSDMRHFAQRGIPCLLYGPGAGFNPHRADEHYLLGDLPVMVKLFLALAQDWCGNH